MCVHPWIDWNRAPATEGKNCQMTSPTARDWSSRFCDWCTARRFAGRAAEPAADGDERAGAAGGLVLVADGVGGFDMCGTAMRYVLAAEKLPYAVEIFPWGHGFGRWFADLTDAAQSRRARHELLAESVRRYKAERPIGSGFPRRQVGRRGGCGQGARAARRAASGAGGAACAGAFAGVRPVVRPPRRTPRAGCFLVTARRVHSGNGNEGIRNSRSRADRWCGNGRVSRAGNGRKAERKQWRANTTNCARFAGGRGWRPRSISAVISERIVPYFCGNTWCRCFGLKRLREVESGVSVKLCVRWVDIPIARPARVLVACRCPGCRSGSI